MSTAPSPSTARPQSPSSSSSGSSETPTRGIDLTVEDTWEDVDSDTEELAFVSLFEDASFPTLEAMLEHDKTTWEFDLKGVVERLELDFYSGIRLVNYVRSQAKNGVHRLDVESKDNFASEEYLTPVLDDDAVLFCLDDLLAAVSNTMANGEANENNEGDSKVAGLEQKLEALQKQFAEYRSTVEKTLDERWSSREAEPSRSSQKTSEDEMNKQYFDSYAYYDIHETMLKDEVRTSAYRDFIYDNKHLFADRVVLDIGCGTGILSLFAAKAGAAHVYAVDNSDIITKAREIVAENGLQDKITCIRGRIEDITLPPVPDSGLRNGITASSGKRMATVDIIVSEWFGYCLLYENMLDSVLHARDTYLRSFPSFSSSSSTTAAANKGDLTSIPQNQKPPLMVPSHTTMHIAPLCDPEWLTSHITFWSSVYGFSMAPMLRGTAPHAEVVLRCVDDACVPAPSSRFKTLDLYTCTRADLEFEKHPFEVTLDRDITEGLHGWVLWFDCFFLTSRRRAGDEIASGSKGKSVLPPNALGESWPGKDREDEGVAFTTGVKGQDTHWMQGCLMIDRGQEKEGSGGTGYIQGPPLSQGQVIRGDIGYKRSAKNSRELEIEVSWDAVGTEEKGRQVWFLR